MAVDPETARFITKNYHVLQGLLFVPFGVMMIIMGTGRVLGLSGFKEGDCTLYTILVPVVIILTLGVTRYYRRRFGEVQHQISPSSVVETLALSAVALALWWFADVLDALWLKDVPVSFAMLVFALFFGLNPITSKGRRHYYFWIAGAIAILALLPVTGLYPKTILGGGSGIAILAIGLSLTLGGLLDHRMLAKNLRLPKEATV